MTYIEDLLPDLGRIIAEDFRDPQAELSEVFEDYVFLFDALYKALSLPDKGQKEVEEAIEEFIQQRQEGEWDTPKGLVFRIRDILQRYEKFQELMVHCQHHTYRSFYNIFFDYYYIIGCVANIFSSQDGEAISKAFKALEEFLQGEKRMWELKDELEKIISELTEGSKEAKP
jgi:hypothetical protein